MYVSDRAGGRFIYQSATVQESSREKCTPPRKRTNKDHFRCLITIWSIGISRRWLNEQIFVKIWNSTKIKMFHFFVCSSKLDRAHSDSFCQHGSHFNKNNWWNTYDSGQCRGKKLFLNPAVYLTPNMIGTLRNCIRMSWLYQHARVPFLWQLAGRGEI